MTQSANPVPPSGPDDGQPGGQAAAEPAAGAVPAARPLVWPPPEHELESWEVVALEPAADTPAGKQDRRAGAASPARGAPVPAGLVGSRDATREASAVLPATGTPDGPGRLGHPTGRRAREAALPAEVEGGLVQPTEARAGRWRVPAWVALAGVIAAAAGGYYAASLWPFWQPAAAATATLLVETMPPGARVLIDGTLRGETPLRVDLSPGTRRVAVESPAGRREAELELRAGADVARFYDFTAAAASRTGILEVQTQPPGARVVVGGQPRGATPVTIRGLAPGLHDVLVSAGNRSVTRRVTIEAGRIASLLVPMAASEPLAAGSLTAASALPFRIEEGGRALGSTGDGPTRLPAGRHDLEFVNDDYGVRLARTVNIVAGRGTAVTLALPPGQVSVNATPWAEVFVDGQRLGETPIGNLSLPVGPHELVFRHPQLGERRQTVQVRAGAPTRVAVNLSR